VGKGLLIHQVSRSHTRPCNPVFSFRQEEQIFLSQPLRPSGLSGGSSPRRRQATPRRLAPKLQMRGALLGIARASAWPAITGIAEGPAQFAVLGH